MMDFFAIMTLLAVTVQFSSNVKMNDISQINHRGAGIADVYQGKNCGLTIELTTEGTVSLSLYSLEGELITPIKYFSSPSMVSPNFDVFESGHYRMVAKHMGRKEVHSVYICS